MSPTIRGISPNWLSYRRLRRHFETNKVYVTALRILIATAYLPGTPTAFPGLPTDLSPARKVAYAIGRACNPQDIIPFLTQSPPSPAALAVREWGGYRGDVCEQILISIVEMGSDFVPYHDVVCIAVECTKVLMEMVGGIILTKRNGMEHDRHFRITNWFCLMKQVSLVLRGIGQISSENEEEGESIPNGCSNLVGSMVRMADKWAKTIEVEETIPIPPSSSTSHEQPPSNGHALDANRASSMPGHQQYMNTSDRWMATNHEQHAYNRGHGHQSIENQAAYPPTAIDLLLGEMFNY